jgi:hypothetical protein
MHKKALDRGLFRFHCAQSAFYKGDGIEMFKKSFYLPVFSFKNARAALIFAFTGFGNFGGTNFAT